MLRRYPQPPQRRGRPPRSYLARRISPGVTDALWIADGGVLLADAIAFPLLGSCGRVRKTDAAPTPADPPQLSEGMLDNLDLLPGLRKLCDRAKGGAGITTAVIDGPMDLDHLVFAGADISITSGATRLPARQVRY